MKAYLNDLPNKSVEHKKRFALLVSGGFTLLIFAVWSFVHFGPEPEVVTETEGPVTLAAAVTAEVSPFANLANGIGDAWSSLTNFITNGQ